MLPCLYSIDNTLSPELPDDPSEVPRAEVKLSQLCPESADGSLPEGRTSTEDIRVGDTISVRVDALYTPYGDMQVTQWWIRR